MKLDSIIALLFGAAFGIRMLDSRRPWWARAAYGAVGYDLVRGAFVSEPLVEMPKLAGFGKTTEKLVGDAKVVPLDFKEHRVRNIQERVAYIHEQMVRSTRDPKVYALARDIIGKKCGGDWCVPEKNALKGVDALQAAIGEVRAIHAAVQERVRYVFDPTDYDAFQTAGKTWELRTGDCDDMVVLEGALLRTIGMQVRSRVVHTTGFETWNHVFLLCALPDGRWVALDPIMKDRPAGWQVPKENWVREPFDAAVVEKGTPRVPKAKA